MAKKNLASLMDGIMGDPKPAITIGPVVKPQEATPISEVTEEMVESLESKRKRNVGRPRKGEEVIKSNEIRATFIVDPELIRKMKYISLVNCELLKDVVDRAFKTYIEAWESGNNKIKLPNAR